MSDLLRTTVYISKRNKKLLDTLSFITKERKSNLLNTALDNHFKTLIKEKNLEEIVKAIDNQE